MTGRDQMFIRIWLAMLVAGMVVSFTSVQTAAHARLESSKPVSGSALPVLPQSIELTFTEPVDPASFRALLFDPVGANIELGAPAFGEDHSAATIDVVTPDSAIPGTYTLSWAAISESDGHDSTGSIVFTSGTGRAPLTGSTQDDTRSPWWEIVARSVLLLALGTLAALLLTQLFRLVPAIALPVVGSIGLLAALIGTGSQSDLVTADKLRIAAGVLSLAAGVVLWATRTRRWPTNAAAVCWAAAVIALASSGHAAGTERPVLATAVASTHMLLTLGWFGMLLGLTVVAWRSRQIPDFSRLARVTAIGLAMLLASGILTAAILLPDQRSIADSGYGVTLAVKGLIVILVLTIAATNRWIVPRWAAAQGRQDDAQTRWLMIGETSLLSGAVLLGAVLSNTGPPARYGTVQVAAPIRTVDERAQVSGVEIALTANITGTVDDRFLIAVSPAPESIQRVIVQTSMTAANGTAFGERFDADATTSGDPGYSFLANRLSVIGVWTIGVILRSAGSEDLVASFEVDTTGWSVPAPVTVERSWQWPIVPAAGWGLLLLAIIVALGGLAVLRRQQGVAPISGAIIILALAMIATGFVIQAVQRSPPRTSGHDLISPGASNLLSAQSDFSTLCVACHGPDGAGLDTVDPNHQHGSGTNLVDERSQTLSDGDLYTLISEGVVSTDMPAFGIALTDQQRWDLVAYVRSLQSAPAATPEADEAWMPGNGGRE